VIDRAYNRKRRSTTVRHKNLAALPPSGCGFRVAGYQGWLASLAHSWLNAEHASGVRIQPGGLVGH